MSSEGIKGFLRLNQVLAIIPVSKSSWYQGIEEGFYPAPKKIGKRSSGWSVAEIEALVEEIDAEV